MTAPPTRTGMTRTSAPSAATTSARCVSASSSSRRLPASSRAPSQLGPMTTRTVSLLSRVLAIALRKSSPGAMAATSIDTSPRAPLPHEVLIEPARPARGSVAAIAEERAADACSLSCADRRAGGPARARYAGGPRRQRSVCRRRRRRAAGRSRGSARSEGPPPGPRAVVPRPSSFEHTCCPIPGERVLRGERLPGTARVAPGRLTTERAGRRCAPSEDAAATGSGGTEPWRVGRRRYRAITNTHPRR